MPGCSAVGCTNRSEQGYCMKVFPKDPHLRKLWADKVKRQNWEPTNNSYLCEVHFDVDQWRKTSEGCKKKLKKDAAPTIFSYTSLQAKRKAPLERFQSQPCKVQKIEKLNCENERPESDEKDVIIKELKTSLEAANDTIKTFTSEINNLKQKVKRLMLENYKLKLEKHANKVEASIFNDDQMIALKRKSMIYTKWSNKTIEVALALRFSCGTTGYETLLSYNLPYPSIRTLQRRLENFKFESGILTEIVEFLKIKVATFSEQEKECVLLLDEMALKENIDYDFSNNTYVGNATFPNTEGKANQALVFMISGICTKWKQTIAYYFTNGKADGIALKNVILNIIKNVESVGLKVNSITSDMSSLNQSMWKAFGIRCGHFSEITTHIIHPYDPNREISFLADVPHLLKNIRTSLLSNKYFIIPELLKQKYQLPNNIISSEHIQSLIQFQKNMDLKLAPKLTEQISHENHFDKMKVTVAKHVISHDVSSALKFLAENNGNKSILTTAWFIESIDKWFCLMTSRNQINALSKKNPEIYNETILFLNEIIYLFKNLKVCNKNGKIAWKPIQTGVIISTTSILRLQQKFLNDLKFHFLLTSRFTQDSLENLFSVVRTKQPQPTALQFKNNLKLISVAQYLKPNSKSSYENDDGQFLPNFLEILQETPRKHKIVLPCTWDRTNDLNLAEQNCLYNIAGYIVSRVMKFDKVCDACVASLGSKEGNTAYYAKLVSLKEYKNKCLFYVTGNVFAYFLKCELIFRSLEEHLLNEKSNCKSLVYEKINSENIKNINFMSCHNIKQKILNRFIRFRLKIFGLKKSKIYLESKKSSRLSATFSSKSMNSTFEK